MVCLARNDGVTDLQAGGVTRAVRPADCRPAPAGQRGGRRIAGSTLERGRAHASVQPANRCRSQRRGRWAMGHVVRPDIVADARGRHGRDDGASGDSDPQTRTAPRLRGLEGSRRRVFQHLPQAQRADRLCGCSWRSPLGERPGARALPDWCAADESKMRTQLSATADRRDQRLGRRWYRLLRRCRSAGARGSRDPASSPKAGFEVEILAAFLIGERAGNPGAGQRPEFVDR